jgi:hypothetical protein
MRTEKIMAKIWRKKIGNFEEEVNLEEELEKGSLWSVECGVWTVGRGRV